MLSIQSGDVNLNGNLGSLSKPDGSAELYLKDSYSIVAVYGPGEVKLMREIADKAYVGVNYRPSTGIPALKEKSIEYLLKSICDGTILTALHPRTLINIVVQEVHNDGSLFACAVNCCCLALLDANIPLKHTFAAVTCMLAADSTDSVIFFPNADQEKKASVIMTFVFDSVDKEMLFLDTNGLYTKQQYNLLYEQAKSHSTKIFDFYRGIISNKYLRKL